MRDPDPVQPLVLDQGLHGGVVERLQLPAASGADLHARLPERLDHVRGQVGPHPAAERRRHLLRQLGQAARLAPARVPLAEQVVEDLAVHVGPPGEPRVVHLGRHQHARRLGRGQQPHPVGVGGPLVPVLLLGVDGEQVVQGQVDPLRFEQRGLRARFGGALRRIGRYGAAAQPGQGRRGRARLPVPPLVAEEQGLRRLHVVAPLDSHPRGEQARCDLGGGPPHPARDFRPAPYRLGGAGLAPYRSGGQPVGAEGGDVHATVLGHGECPPVGHVASVAAGSDNAAAAIAAASSPSFGRDRGRQPFPSPPSSPAFMSASTSVTYRSIGSLPIPSPLSTPSPFSCSSRASRMCSVPM